MIKGIRKCSAKHSESIPCCWISTEHLMYPSHFIYNHPDKPVHLTWEENKIQKKQLAKFMEGASHGTEFCIKSASPALSQSSVVFKLWVTNKKER